jgi:hypothetical protein
MATKSSFSRIFRKLDSVSAAYLFVGGIVVLSMATLIMVIAQPDVVRNSSRATENKLYFSVPSHKLDRDSVFDVQVMADSGTTNVNAIQARIEYPADKLLFYGIRQSAAFPVEAATSTATPGTILIGRGTELGSSGVSGKNEIVTLSFKVLDDSVESSLIKFDPASSMLVKATDNTNILAGTTGVYLHAD